MLAGLGARAHQRPRSDKLYNIKRVLIHMGHLFRVVCVGLLRNLALHNTASRVTSFFCVRASGTRTRVKNALSPTNLRTTPQFRSISGWQQSLPLSLQDLSPIPVE